MADVGPPLPQPSVGFTFYDGITVSIFATFVVVVAIYVIVALVSRGRYRKSKNDATRQSAIAAVEKENRRLKDIQDTTDRLKLVNRAADLNTRLPPGRCEIVDQFLTAKTKYSLPSDSEMNIIAARAYHTANASRMPSDQPCAPPVFRPKTLSSSSQFTYVVSKQIYSFLKFTISARGTIGFPKNDATSRKKLPQLSARVIRFVDNADSTSAQPTISDGLTFSNFTLTENQMGSTSSSVPFDAKSGVLSIKSTRNPPILAYRGDVIQFFAVNFEEAVFKSFECSVAADDFLVENPNMLKNTSSPPPSTSNTSIETS